MRPVILWRDEADFAEDELPSAAKYFYCTNSRMDIKPGDLVIGRFSVLPFYEEQARDVERVGARLVNTFRQHRYIADVNHWYRDFVDLTPRTWTQDEYPTCGYDGPVVLKGETNSKKFLWETHMFAASRQAATLTMFRLFDDSLVGTQRIMFREFEPFVTYTVGNHGLPITKEFRFFFFEGRVLSGGYYWSSFIEDLNQIGIPKEELDPAQVPREFLADIGQRLATVAPFVVVDVAQHQDGRWRVVELNDGQMSGRSENNPEVLYRELSKACRRNSPTGEISL